MNSIPRQIEPQAVAVLAGLGHGGAQLADVREVDLAGSGHDGGASVPRGADGEVVVHWCAVTYPQLPPTQRRDYRSTGRWHISMTFPRRRSACARSRACWWPRATSIRPRWTRWSRPTSTRSGRISARAWSPAPGSIRPIRERLLADATRGDRRARDHRPRRASTWWRCSTPPEVHNLVVCTLCSCYPWTVLGLPPVWYKSAPYRSRAVSDPRGVLARLRGRRWAEDVACACGTRRRGPLPRACRCARRHRRLVRGGVGRARHARRDDRRRRPVNGAHDMGGVHGFGPVVAEADEPVFHADWERRVLGAGRSRWARAGAGTSTCRASRARTGRPAEYLSLSYYEIWLAGLERLLAEQRAARRGRCRRPRAPARCSRACWPAAYRPNARRRGRRGSPSATRADAEHPPAAATRGCRATRAGKVGVDRARARLPRLPGRELDAVRRRGPAVALHRGASPATELWGPDGDPTLAVSLRRLRAVP